MPKIVDHDNRRREISAAAMRILAKDGPEGLTLKALARELRGSITLITHFFADRQTLLDGLADELARYYDEDLESLEMTGDALNDLRAYLRWMVPLSPDEVEVERCRVALVHSVGNASVARFFDVMESKARDAFRVRLQSIVPPGHLDGLIDFLRVVVNGAVLSAVEQPALWSEARLQAVIETSIDAVRQAGSSLRNS